MLKSLLVYINQKFQFLKPVIIKECQVKWMRNLLMSNLIPPLNAKETCLPFSMERIGGKDLLLANILIDEFGS